MNISTILPISEGRKRIFEIADEVQKANTFYTLTERGLPKVIIISASEFESWQETLEVKKDFPRLAKDIKEAEKDYKEGNYITLEKFLAKEGYIKKKYAISRNTSRKSEKRSSKNR